jgi:hypothetical protein
MSTLKPVESTRFGMQKCLPHEIKKFDVIIEEYIKKINNWALFGRHLIFAINCLILLIEVKDNSGS